MYLRNFIISEYTTFTQFNKLYCKHTRKLVNKIYLTSPY